MADKTPEQIAAEEKAAQEKQAKAQAEVFEKEAAKPGRFVVNGALVDFNGAPVTDAKGAPIRAQ